MEIPSLRSLLGVVFKLFFHHSNRVWKLGGLQGWRSPKILLKIGLMSGKTTVTILMSGSFGWIDNFFQMRQHDLVTKGIVGQCLGSLAVGARLIGIRGVLATSYS